MKFKELAFLSLIFVSTFAFAAKQKKDLPKKNTTQKAEELIQFQKSKLSSVGENKTTSLIHVETPEDLNMKYKNKNRIIAFGAQAYKPEGLGRVGKSDAFELSEIGYSPMALLNLNYEFSSVMREKLTPLLMSETGYAFQDLKLKRDNGFTYNNVKLHSFIQTFGLGAKYQITNSFPTYLGFHGDLGLLNHTQTSAYSSINSNFNEIFAGAGAFLQIPIKQKYFVQADYSFRRNLRETWTAKIASHRGALFLGMRF